MGEGCGAAWSLVCTIVFNMTRFMLDSVVSPRVTDVFEVIGFAEENSDDLLIGRHGASIGIMRGAST